MRNSTTQNILFLLLLTALTVVTLTACNSLWLKQSQRLTVVQSPVNTQIVSGAFGQVEVPLHPQRVVVLDGSGILGSMLALGIKPVGYAPCLDCIGEDALSELVADVPVIGDIGQPSLEKILSLKPDLILAHKWQSQSYPLLSSIAPTVAINPGDEADFKKELRFLAQIVNRSEQAEEIIAKYNDRIQKFREELGVNLENKTVSILHLYGSRMTAYGPSATTYGQVMNDAGLQFIQAYKDLKNGYLDNISSETLPEWDADFLFLVIVYKQHKDLMSLQFLEQPIWSTLKAVQNKQVYAVDWASAGGPIGANRIIDDLYQYFADTSVQDSKTKPR